MSKKIKFYFPREIASLILGIIITFGLFLVLPILQIITEPPSKDLTIRMADTVNIPPPPPPPPAEEPEEPEPEEVPPPLVVDTQPLDLSQLELALNPGDGGFGGSEFEIDISNVAGKSEDVNAIFSLSDLDQKPRAVFKPMPIIPKNEVNKRGYQGGTVYVLFIVNEQGRTENLKIQKSFNTKFNNSALAAVKKWKFEPGKRKGKPVKFRMRVPITYE
jgi:protein TonB